MNSPSPLDSEPKFRAWKESVTAAGCTIQSIRILHELRKKNRDLLFLLLDCAIISPEGHAIPNIIFIRGDACLIVPLIRNRDTHEERFLMIRQRRVGSGQLSLEFPAGMLDNNTNDPRGVATHEIEEETGIAIQSDKLFPLCEKKLYSSVGASDEAIFYFGCIIDLPDAEYQSLKGRLCGNPDEDEHITVTLISRSEAESEATSLQAHLGFYLFEDYVKRL